MGETPLDDEMINRLWDDYIKSEPITFNEFKDEFLGSFDSTIQGKNWLDSFGDEGLNMIWDKKKPTIYKSTKSKTKESKLAQRIILRHKTNKGYVSTLFKATFIKQIFTKFKYQKYKR